MSPEAVEATAGAAPALDVWAAGALAVELVTGQPPYAHLAPMAALFRIVQDPEPPIPGGSSSCSGGDGKKSQVISAELEDFLRACSVRDPAARPPAARSKP
jgi:serine/threonine protein kinase